MSDDNENGEIGTEAMHRREITLADGRYMIFYTFGDELTVREENEQGENV